MTHNHNTPTREAVVMIIKGKDDWAPVIEVDPISLPVDVDGYADVFDPGLIGLLDGLITWDALDDSGEYALVWSGTHELVKGVCPSCDEVFSVSDGYPVDQFSEDAAGQEAVRCGCEDENED